MSDDDSEEEDWQFAVATKTEQVWLQQHYDVLQQLYSDFKNNGEAYFGRWFFQSGGFYHFVQFVYAHSLLSSKPP